MQHRLLILVFLFFFSTQSFASFDVLTITNSNSQKQDARAQAQSKLGFVTYKNFRLYRLTTKFPAQLKGYKISDETSAALRANDSVALLVSDDFKGNFNMSNGSDQKNINYVYRPAANQLGIKIEKCSQYNLNIKANKRPAPSVLLAINCEKIGDRILLSVSTMGTANINSSSLNEIDGKGESWRAFDLGTIKAEASTALEMSMSSSDGAEFGITVLTKKIEDKKNENSENEKKQIIKVGLAYSMTSLAIANNYSDSSPGLFVNFTSKPLFFGAQLGADFKQFFAADTPIAISTSDFKGIIKKDFTLSETFSIGPKLIFTNAKYSQAVSNLDFNVVSFGGGFDTSYYFSKRESVDFSYQMLSFGSQVVSSAANMRLGVNFILFKDYNFNLGLEMQNITGKSAGGNTIKVDQNIVTIGVGFD